MENYHLSKCLWLVRQIKREKEKERYQSQKTFLKKKIFFWQNISLLKKNKNKKTQGEEQIMLGRFYLLENLSFPEVCQNSRSSVCLKSPPVGEKWRLTWLFSRSQNADSLWKMKKINLFLKLQPIWHLPLINPLLFECKEFTLPSVYVCERETRAK